MEDIASSDVDIAHVGLVYAKVSEAVVVLRHPGERAFLRGGIQQHIYGRV